MRCELSERLSAYHDGELAADERAAVERHLNKCAECRAEVARGSRRLLHELKGMAVASITPAAVARLHDVVDCQPGIAIRRMAGILAAAAAAVLAVCLFGLAKQERTEAAALPEWESEAVTQASASAGTEDTIAMWVAQDLATRDKK